MTWSNNALTSAFFKVERQTFVVYPKNFRGEKKKANIIRVETQAHNLYLFKYYCT